MIAVENITMRWYFHVGKIEDFKGTYEESQLTAQRKAG